MLNAKEFQEQLEWLWLFCQEEAWFELHDLPWE